MDAMNMWACGRRGNGLSLLLAVLSAISAQAQTEAIGVNFVGGGGTLAGEDSAGVVPAVNWNNASGRSGSDITGLVYSDGTTVDGLSLSYTAPDTWNNGWSTTDGDRTMLHGYLDESSGQGQPGQSIIITLSGVPYANFDLYVYGEGDNSNQGEIGRYRVYAGAGTGGAVLGEFWMLDPVNGGYRGLIQATTTSWNGNADTAYDTAIAEVNDGSYVHFANVSDSMITIEALAVWCKFANDSQGWKRAPINGIQIVQTTPPPTPPVVTNLAATGITGDSAWLNGQVTSTGFATTVAWVYWGPADGGTTPELWSNVCEFGVVGIEGLTTNVIGLGLRTTYYYRFCASNSFGTVWADESASFATPNSPPVLTDGEVVDVTMSEDGTPTPFSLTLNATDADGDGDILVWSVLTNALHGGASVNQSGEWAPIDYWPSTDWYGADSFVVQVSDGYDADTILVQVTVESVNDLPIAVEESYEAYEETELVLDAVAGVLSNDSDPDGGTLSVAVSVPPEHAATFNLNSDGSFSYRGVDDYYGMDYFTYELSDGQGGTVQCTVTLYVNGINDPPVAHDDAYSVPANGTLTVDGSSGLLANDTDADGGDTLVASLAGTPVHGSVEVAADGGFAFTPEVYFTGNAGFLYQVDDQQGGVVTGTVSVTVSAVQTAYETWATDRIGNGQTSELQDADGDGVPNWQEWVVDSDPMASNGAFAVLGLVATNSGRSVISFLTSTARLYDVFCSTNLADVTRINWPDSLTNAMPGNGGVMNVADPDPVAPKFYRVRVRTE